MSGLPERQRGTPATENPPPPHDCRAAPADTEPGNVALTVLCLSRRSGESTRTRLSSRQKAPKPAAPKQQEISLPDKAGQARKRAGGSKAPRDRKRSGAETSRPTPPKQPRAVAPEPMLPPPPPESTFSTKLSLAEQEEEEMLAALNAQVPPVKGPWSTHEDEQLSVLVQQYGPKRWSLIASKLPGRIGKQVRPPRLCSLASA